MIYNVNWIILGKKVTLRQWDFQWSANPKMKTFHLFICVIYIDTERYSHWYLLLILIHMLFLFIKHQHHLIELTWCNQIYSKGQKTALISMGLQFNSILHMATPKLVMVKAPVVTSLSAVSQHVGKFHYRESRAASSFCPVWFPF